MTARELRDKYLEFFKAKGHKVVPSAPLIPIDVTGREDTSLLFTGAGMVQFKPYFRGLVEPPSKRLVDVQKCMRTSDIDDVGDASHLTFFEMLGNFSFGDYFKKDAIAFSWEFMTSKNWLGLDPKRLAFTVYEKDDESFNCWAEILRSAEVRSAPETRIFRLGEETNFWPAGSFTKGPPGPCGPNTEMFYWVSKEEPPPACLQEEGAGGGGSLAPNKREGAGGGGISPPRPVSQQGEGAGGEGSRYGKQDFLRDLDAGKWLEIWNDVFIEFEWKGHLADPSRPDKGWVKEGLDPLPFQSVDTGMGLERTITVLNGKRSVYDNDLFEPILRTLGNLVLESGHAPALLDDDPATPNVERLVSIWSSKTQEDAPHCVAARIVADHARSACFCIADGILPSNTGRGYVLRRLIRRAVLKGQRVLGLNDPFLFKIVDGVAEALGKHYSGLIERKETIVQTLRSEEVLFRRTLDAGHSTFIDLVSGAVMASAADIPKLNLQLKAPVQIYDAEWKELISLASSEGKSPRDAIDDEFEFLRRFHEIGENMTRLCSTLSVGRAIFEEILQRKGDPDPRWIINLKGEHAFRLYDTFGFPLEVTRELCEEASIEIDIDGYYNALAEAQKKSKAAHGGETVYGGVDVQSVQLDQLLPSKEARKPTAFTGYKATQSKAKIIGALQQGDKIFVALDKSPFYVEAGGEVSDTGSLRGKDFTLEVVGLFKQDGVIVHIAKGNVKDVKKLIGKIVTAEVDAPRRRQITRHHTATHLLHAALRQVLGKHVTQAGSLVAPDHLRFDFTHGKALTEEELTNVERLVNEKIFEGIPVKAQENVPIAEAKNRGAMALFGEKYGDTVRTIEIEGFSLELCGGCHVKNSAEIGLFKIARQSATGSGVRRIEAVTGEGVYKWLGEIESQVKQIAAKFKTNPNNIVTVAEKLQEQLGEEKRRIERMRTQAASDSQGVTKRVGSVEIALEKLTEGELADATLVADRLVEGKPDRVAVVALVSNGKVNLVVKAGKDAQAKGAHAGNLVRDVAKIVGGGGGGRPDFATAGGKDASAIDKALEAAPELLGAQLQSN